MNGAAAANVVADHLQGYRYAWTSEVELQDAIWDVLAPNFNAVRERALSRRDRPDFLVHVDGLGSVAVEVKITGSRNAVMRQLGRYAEHDDIDAVILASGRRVLAAAMPTVIHTKPVLAIHLGSAL